MELDNITHQIDKNGNVVIDASWNHISYEAVLVPKIIDGRVYLKKSDINTDGVDWSKDIKDAIVSFITTNRGKNKEMPIIVKEDWCHKNTNNSI